MNYETARKLLVAQTIISEENPDALLMRMTQGKPPVPGQITSILLALKVVFEGLKESSIIDRELAFSLYQLAVKAQQIFVAGRKLGVDWPPLLKEDLLRISLAAESIFSGVWQTPPSVDRLKDKI
ncbi:Dethiobiotin synthetase [Nostoc sp. UHCC 0702]|nr:Dethiobiotin synthetase [Nostoc sp. UHCC 0702]